jgi:hypothetical protein
MPSARGCIRLHLLAAMVPQNVRDSMNTEVPSRLFVLKHICVEPLQIFGVHIEVVETIVLAKPSDTYN